MKKDSLRKKINFNFFIVFFVVLIMLSYVSFSQLYQAEIENEKEIANVIGKQYLSDIEYIYRQTLRSMYEIEIEVKKQNISREEIDHLIKDDLRTNQYLANIEFCSKEDLSDVEVVDCILIDKIKENNRFYVIAPYYKLINEIETLVISFTLPINDFKGNFLGIVKADMNISKFQNDIKRLNVDGGYGIIIDNYYEIIADGKYSEFIMKNYNEKYENIKSQIDLGEEFLISTKSVFTNEKELKIFIPIEFQNSKIKWFFVLVRPFNVILVRFFDTLRAFFIILILTVIAASYVLNKLSIQITKPLKILVKSMDEISDGNYEISVPLSSNDEIGELSKKFNYMAKSINVYKTETTILNRKLEFRKHNFKTLFESSADAVLIIEEDEIIDCNKSAYKLFGDGTKESILFKSIIDISPKHQFLEKSSEKEYYKKMNYCREYENNKFEWIHKGRNNSKIITEVNLIKIILNDKEVYHASIRDISDRKKMQQELEYISYHDQLTDLYNRRFFEEELKRLDVKRNYPLAIIIGDVNGLKLVNDSFGHKMGDELIKKVGYIFKTACRADDIIARIGGDEFAIIMPDADDNKINILINRINKISSDNKVDFLNVSISFGCMMKQNEKQNIEEIMKIADENMYNNKILEGSRIRKKNIDSIMQALYEKSEYEEICSKKVSEICKEMGKALKLPANEIEKLTNIGLFYNIGKISISEEILNKKGELSDDELLEMEKHSELGYRILNTVKEMAYMSESILYQYEKYNGEGYSKGVKGKKIPLAARIISIADVFCEQIYRMKATKEEAINKVMSYSGSYFDPELTIIFKEIIENSNL